MSAVGRLGVATYDGSARVTFDRFDVPLDGGCRGMGASVAAAAAAAARDLFIVAKALVTVDEIGGKFGPVEPFVLWYIRFRFAARACSFVGVVSGWSVVFISKLRSGAKRS